MTTNRLRRARDAYSSASNNACWAEEHGTPDQRIEAHIAYHEARINLEAAEQAAKENAS